MVLGDGSIPNETTVKCCSCGMIFGKIADPKPKPKEVAKQHGLVHKKGGHWQCKECWEAGHI